MLMKAVALDVGDGLGGGGGMMEGWPRYAVLLWVINKCIAEVLWGRSWANAAGERQGPCMERPRHHHRGACGRQ